MRSHLTRRVFQRLIANEPVVRHRTFHRPSRPQATFRDGHSIRRRMPYRTFFGFFQKPQRDMSEPLLDPGMEKMLELDKRIHLVARLPPPVDLVVAFRAFVQSKIDKKRPIEDFHASRLLQTLRGIEERDDVELDEEGNRPSGSRLDVQDLRAVFRALMVPAQVYSDVHVELVRDLWSTLQKLVKISSDPSHKEQPPRGYITVLCSTGNTAEARATIESVGGDVAPSTSDVDSMQWNRVLAGFAKEDNEGEILQTIQMLQSSGEASDRYRKRIMGIYYAQKNNVSETKRWFVKEALSHSTTQEKRAHATLGSLIPSTDAAYRELLRFCLENGQLEWGQSVIQSAYNPAHEGVAPANEKMWNAIFMASAATGKSVDDIDRMVAVMARRAKEANKEELGPTVHTFNGLIRLAISKRDPYIAERYFGLLKKWHVEPDVETYILQIEYRIIANDLDGANASYARLRDQEVVGDQDWPIMNKLLYALIAEPKVSNEIIMGLVEDLSERKQVFPADTVICLCEYHIKRDEYFEVVDLLQTYAYQFSVSDRLRIRDLLADYSLSGSTDTGRAWDTYMIFHQVFDLETRRDIRNDMMRFFFERGRPDLATHVFTRMNQHMRRDTRPNADTYVLAFEGIAKNSDPEALEVVHNLLKLDTETEPSTKIYNALMLAYISCEIPVRALDFWRQIATSHEGPSYESLHIAFRACENAPFGHRQAAAIWDKLRQADIEISRDLFANYVACLSGQSLLKECFEGLRKMKDVCGYDVDLFTIGSVYNASIGISHQDRIEHWCEEHYPKVWEEALEKGRDEDETGLQRVRGIDRTLKA